MTDLRIALGRLFASPNGADRYTAENDGLVLSYYPAEPRLVAGRLGRFPTTAEQGAILATIRRCTGVGGVVMGDRLDRPGGYWCIEYSWRPKPEPAEEACPEPGQKVYQVIRYGKGGYPYTGGIHTDPGETQAMARRGGGRYTIQTTTIDPTPIRIAYGMTAPKRLKSIKLARNP